MDIISPDQAIVFGRCCINRALPHTKLSLQMIPLYSNSDMDLLLLSKEQQHVQINFQKKSLIMPSKIFIIKSQLFSHGLLHFLVKQPIKLFQEKRMYYGVYSLKIFATQRSGFYQTQVD